MAKRPAFIVPDHWPIKDSFIYWPLDHIIPYDKNARTHPPEQIALLAQLLKKYGPDQHIVVDERREILKGHGRRLSSIAAGLTHYPVVQRHGLSEAEKLAMRIADNQIALLAGWDANLIRGEVVSLKTAGYDIALLGFPEVQLRAWSISVGPIAAQDPEAVPEPPKNPISRRGDIWILGRHRMMCGDSCDVSDVRRLTAGIVPDIANCDPPYGIKVVKGALGAGKVGGGKPHPFAGKNGSVMARKEIIAPGIYAPIIGDDTIETAVKSYGVLLELKVPVIAMWGANYYANALPNSRCWLIWDKENTSSFADAELAWTNQDAIVRLIRHQWSGLIKASERRERRVHPTQKPVALSEWVIDILAPKSKTAIDLFMGSGAMLIACERKSIACYGVEMAEPYCDVIVERWENFVGADATLDGDGRTFKEIRADRRRGRLGTRKGRRASRSG